MEGFAGDCEFLRRAAGALKQEKFTLIDVGCSGGIDALWRLYGDKLRAIGFDPNIEECEHLAAIETNPSIRYVPAFVDIRPDHPFARKTQGKSPWGNSPWNRLSVARTVQLRQKEIGNLPLQDKIDFNAWRQTRLADENDPVFLPEFFAKNQIADIDFIKLDVDGPDFAILNSLDDVLSGACVLGFGMEVNFVGSASETDHTFHNSDRFMRSHGFDLFHLTVRHYSTTALPSRYLLTVPAQTEFGRSFQGDALYMRDLCDPGVSAFADQLSAEKILKSAAIFAAFNLPDCAAEILVKFRSRLAGLCGAGACDIDVLLDTLAAQAQQGSGSTMGYKDYIAAFERDDDRFYAQKRTTGPAQPAAPTGGGLRSTLARIIGR
jgi:hypothetical protein